MPTPELVRQQLEPLNLDQAVAVLESRLDWASGRDTTYIEFLSGLLQAELDVRRERYLKARLRLARLPFQETLADSDFAVQPALDERQMKVLATLNFVHETVNVLLLGPPDPDTRFSPLCIRIESRLSHLDIQVADQNHRPLSV